ncbi:MAG: acylphosphatase [Selenomonadaceae bacterium]|nr:acylphosphatase [Selenomonadaceae bacterium]
MENAVRKEITVSGRVQGVGFRFFTQQTALNLRITGWVKNQSDGSVIMEVQGTPQQLDALITRLKQGNGYSKVEQMKIEDLEVDKGENKFGIRY